MPFYFHSDAGHGWLAAKRQDLKDLGILGRITNYSYQRGKTVYLEEDCDAPLFLKAYERKYGKKPEIKRAKELNRSPIRGYHRFATSAS